MFKIGDRVKLKEELYEGLSFIIYEIINSKGRNIYLLKDNLGYKLCSYIYEDEIAIC